MASWWSHVYGTAAQGLQITIVGMALVFFTLGLIIVSMVLLTQLPGLRSSKAGQQPKEAPEERQPSSQQSLSHLLAVMSLRRSPPLP